MLFVSLSFSLSPINRVETRMPLYSPYPDAQINAISALQRGHILLPQHVFLTYSIVWLSCLCIFGEEGKEWQCYQLFPTTVATWYERQVFVSKVMTWAGLRICVWMKRVCVQGITSDAWDRWLDSLGEAIAALSKPIGQLSCCCWQHSFVGSKELGSLSRCCGLFDGNM